VLHHYSLEGETAMPGGLHARLCYAFLVFFMLPVFCGATSRVVSLIRRVTLACLLPCCVLSVTEQINVDRHLGV